MAVVVAACCPPSSPRAPGAAGRSGCEGGKESVGEKSPPTTTASTRRHHVPKMPRASVRAIPSGGRCRTGWCRWVAGAGKPACAWPWGSAPGGWSCCGRGAPRGPASRRRRRCCGRTGAPWRRRGGGSAPGWARGPAMGETKQGVILDTESSLRLRSLSASPGARVCGGPPCPATHVAVPELCRGGCGLAPDG